MIRKSKSGFTLIELLVVIAIIAILAAILFPVFAKAREKARQSQCLSNVKQLTLGILMYKDDYDQTFPPACAAAAQQYDGSPATDWWTSDCWADWRWSYYQYDPGTCLVSWQDLIYPYTKSMKVANCPSSAGGSWGSSGTGQGIAQGHYGANAFIIGYPSPLNHPGGPLIDPYKDAVTVSGCNIKNDAAVQDPASKYLIMDFGCYSAYYWECISPWRSHYLPGSGKFDYVRAYNEAYGAEYAVGAKNGNPDDGVISDWTNARHNGGVVVGYADGHASWMSVTNVLQSAKDTAENISNRGVAGYTPKTEHWTPEWAN